MEVSTRIQICQVLILFAKHRELRKLFFDRDLLNWLLELAMKIVDEQQKQKAGAQVVLITTVIRLLVVVCTIKKIPYYVPGESNLQERLRKRSLDSGCFSVLCQIYLELSEETRSPFTEILRELSELLGYADIADLCYHLRVLDLMDQS
jgi:hypothetical protein